MIDNSNKKNGLYSSQNHKPVVRPSVPHVWPILCLRHIWVPSCFVPHLQLMKGEQQSARRNSGSQVTLAHIFRNVKVPKSGFCYQIAKNSSFSGWSRIARLLINILHFSFRQFLWGHRPRLGGVVASRFRIYYTPEPAKARTPLDQLPSW